MTFVKLHVSDPYTGDVTIDNGGKPDDNSLMSDPRTQISVDIDEVVERVKSAYNIESRVTSEINSTKLGEAILAVVQRWGTDTIHPKTLGERVLMFMKDPSAFPMAGRPIKDSPQA